MLTYLSRKSKLYLFKINKFYYSKMQSSKFNSVDENISFPKKEEEVLQYWEKINAFHTQLKKTEHFPKYTFYDGPPFATGLPHYGHLTVGTIKDVVTRYWTQNGRYVERRFGWDCHGLPIECKINEMLQIKTKKDLLNLGIEKYNSECRSIVMKYSNDWKWYTQRFGRWIDFEKDYKTLDLNFMESVWWVFKQIFEKDLVYRKCKVMPYSAACNTVLSNFEAGLNYKDVNDPSVIVSFPSVEDNNVKFLAWTTTPWTLPSNLFLAVNPNLTYLKIKVDGHEDKQYIFAESLLDSVKSKLNIENFTVVEKYKGSDLHGKEYVPLYDDFYKQFHEKGCFKVYTADYVSATDGTGIVHNAPGFGEDDYRVGVQYNVIDADKPLCPIDDDGMFTSAFPLTAGKHFKEADSIIMANLKSRQRLMYHGTIVHKYPYCYRTETPLMYRAVPSWFIKVESMKNDLVENNLKTTWVPKYVQEKRFHNWLADAKDWCISRNRCWGNPIPIWVSEDFDEKICIGSVEELRKLTGREDITDLHREFIDGLTIPSQKGKGNLRRIEEVFDCWFESGSMPYAQLHYPFDISEEEFAKRFPADFIGEGLDQTRGWFYTLNVISTALFNKPPYKNLIVNGLVLAEDGKKLSKKDMNFKDPKEMFELYGADAIRLYLINSPLVRGQSLKFSEKGLKEVIKDVFLPLYNSYRFLIQNIQRYESSNGKTYTYNFKNITSNLDSLNITDRWIIAYNQRLIKFVRNEMENYRLYTVVIELLSFLDKLTNWYIRLNRGRLKGDYGVEDNLNSLNVLFNTLENLVILLSPFVPFITEGIYQNLKNGLENYEDSIHYLQIPSYNESLIDYKIEEVMNNMITVIELGRQLREKKGLSLKRPVASIQVINFNKTFLDNLKIVEDYIKDELNANELILTEEENKFIKISSKANFEVLYKRSKDLNQMMKDEEKEDDPELKKDAEVAKNEANVIAAVIKTLGESELRELISNKQLKKDGHTITVDQVIIEKKFLKEYEAEKEYCCSSNQECGIRINTASNETIMNAYLAREIVNRVQKLRKETGIKISDNIIVVYSFEGPAEKLSNVCSKFNDYINKVLKVPFTNEKPDQSHHQHAIAEYDIVTELEEKDTSKKEEDKPKEKLTKEQRKIIAKLKEDEKKDDKKDDKKEPKKVENVQGVSEKVRFTILKK
jgi:isoleucyl-tRNA synthetase